MTQEENIALGEQAFGNDSDTLTIVKYEAHQEAVRFLTTALRKPGGVGVLHGRAGSGKTITLGELALGLIGDANIAFVDGMHLALRTLLDRMLSQFGQYADSGTDEEVLDTIRYFAVQQTQTAQAPVLIIDNLDAMQPATLRIVQALASVTVNGQYAMRFIFSGGDGLPALIDSDGMVAIAQREPAWISLQPVSPKETMIYLHARVKAAGRDEASTVFPFDVCDRLQDQSGGWPGQLNHYALEAIMRSSKFPISVANTKAPVEPEAPAAGSGHEHREPPQLIVTRDGTTLGTYKFREKKVLIGRSDFADIIIDDDFVSKLHAVLMLYADALVMLDLNSANGITVNSVVVKKTILKSDDIITLGNHKIKVQNAPPISVEMERIMKSRDTLRLQNLVDLRREQARRNIK